MGNNKVLIGRSSKCDYTIENIDQHGTVSGKHATISETCIPNTYLFEDHSTNGSYINGQLLHSSSCKITVADHITLGRTYTLPLDDIVKRYFTERRTTKKKSQDERTETQSQVRHDVKEVNYLRPYYRRPSTFTSDATMQASASVTETITVEKVPNWFWVLYAVTILIAFAAGYFMYNLIN